MIWSRSRRGGIERAAVERAARIRLLNTDLEVLRATAVERTRQTETKASFIVVAAGVLASAAGIELIKIETWLAGLLPFGLTIATVVFATVALWPRPLQVSSARNIVNLWVDSSESLDDLDDYLLETKAHEIELRDKQNELRAKWTKRGFVFLLASLATAVPVATANALSPIWSGHVQERIETPATPEATDAP